MLKKTLTAVAIATLALSAQAADVLKVAATAVPHAEILNFIKPQLKADGIGIFLISHDIHDVFDLADRVVVMKNGQVVGEARTSEVTKDEVLGMIIMGKVPPGAHPGPGAIVS